MQNKKYYIPEFETITLSNGLKVFWHERPTINTIGLKVFVKIGSANEQLEGSAHLIEHILYSSLRDLFVEHNMDVHINGTTLREYTRYPLAVALGDFEETLRFLGEHFFSIDFNEEKLDREKNRVLNEIAEYEDEPKSTIHELMNKCVYIEKNSAFRDTLGARDKIESLKLEDLSKIYEDQYHPRNTCIAISAPFRLTKDLQKKLEAMLGGITEKTGQQLRIRKSTPAKPSVKSFARDNLSQIYLSVGFPIENKFSFEKMFVIDTASALVYQVVSAIRDEGYVYSIDSDYTVAGEYAHMYVGAVFKDNKDFKSGLIRLKELMSLRQPEEFLRRKFSAAKKSAVRSILIDFESDSAILNDIGWYYMNYGGNINFRELLSKTERVTFENALKTAREVFNLDRATITTLNSPKDKSSVERIIKEVLRR